MERDSYKDLLTDLRKHAESLGESSFVRRQLVEAVVRQIRASAHYSLPFNGYLDRIDDRDRTPGSNALFRLPNQQILLQWESDAGEHAALAFETVSTFPASCCVPPAWRMYFPKEFAPRRGDLAVVPFGYADGKFVPPAVAIVFGPDDYFWRNEQNGKPLRTAVIVRGSLCLENPRIAAFAPELRARLDSGYCTYQEILAHCSLAAGVLESFCANLNHPCVRTVEVTGDGGGRVHRRVLVR